MKVLRQQPVKQHPASLKPFQDRPEKKRTGYHLILSWKCMKATFCALAPQYQPSHYSVSLDKTLGPWHAVKQNTWYQCYKTRLNLYLRQQEGTVITKLSPSKTKGYYHTTGTVREIPINSLNSTPTNWEQCLDTTPNEPFPQHKLRDTTTRPPHPQHTYRPTHRAPNIRQRRITPPPRTGSSGGMDNIHRTTIIPLRDIYHGEHQLIYITPDRTRRNIPSITPPRLPQHDPQNG